MDAIREDAHGGVRQARLAYRPLAAHVNITARRHRHHFISGLALASRTLVLTVNRFAA
jgi:hypothetical protein